MLSRRNLKLFIQKQQPHKQRFGIRKLSIGVVSVLLGLVFVTGGKTASANASLGTTPADNFVIVSSAPVDKQSTSEVSSLVDSTAVNAISAQPSSASAEAAGAGVDNDPVNVPAQSGSAPTSQAAGEVNSSQPAISDGTGNNSSVTGSIGAGVQIPASTGPETVASSGGATPEPARKNEVQVIDKIQTDQILKDKYGIDVNHLDAKSVLMLASLFHIFANEANLGADVNGNIAVGILNSSVDFGTRGDSVHLTQGDIYYIQKLNAALQNGSFRNEKFNHVVFGQDVNVEIIDGKVYVNGHHMVNLKAEEVFKDSTGTSYIDFPAIFQRLLLASNFYANQEESAGVIKDFADMNNRYVDVSNAVPKDNVIYVNIPFEYLSAAQPIKIYGLSSKVHGPTVVINVIGMPAGGTVSINTQIKLYYDDDGNHVNPGESHAVPNHVLWNFGETAAHITFASGHFMGSILAPNATVTAGVNVDGNIIANIVNITGGESHKWDIHPVIPPSFIEIPEQPTDPQPTDPQPTDPQPTAPQPTDPQPTDPQPTDPQPTAPQPTDPQPTDPQPTDPQPTDPQPTDPQPTDPQPTDPQPTNPQPTDPQPTDPQPTAPQPTTPQPTNPQPTAPQPTNPQPTAPQPTDPVIIPPTTDMENAGATNPGRDDDDTDSQPAPSSPAARPTIKNSLALVAHGLARTVAVSPPPQVQQELPVQSPVMLPQTGNSSRGALLGVIATIMVQLLVWGLVQPTRKKK